MSVREIQEDKTPYILLLFNQFSFKELDSGNTTARSLLKMLLFSQKRLLIFLLQVIHFSLFLDILKVNRRFGSSTGLLLVLILCETIDMLYHMIFGKPFMYWSIQVPQILVSIIFEGPSASHNSNKTFSNREYWLYPRKCHLHLIGWLWFCYQSENALT